MKNFNIPKAIFLGVTVAFALSTYKIYFPNKDKVTSHLPSEKLKNSKSQDSNISTRPKSFDFTRAESLGHLENTKRVQSLPKNESNFIQAIELKNPQVIKDYISSINPSYVYPEDRMTPLMLLVENDYIEAFKMALKKVRSQDIDLQNKYGASALVLSSSGANEEMTKLLLERGANPNIKFNKRNYTLLMDCAFEGQYELCKLLLEAGADVNTQDKDGKSALIYAAREGHEAVVKILLRHGADKNLKDSKGMRAQDYAYKHNFQVVLEHLK
ncbi:ankyrin repeat domain-containing protein [Bacteriovorax sp. DB6_IX]|uniref:ankyrin repeat domain-containing protein n=1 Tax=Bacteriovorax sp. DB6_IX TaxID=1353530 RepID=UPI000389E319|nr:ankyrin repeat domain-containing protein [Bacteriovorax sp. DB6_IX]EQC51587.1 ankyrin repeat protein [Bacteriovorax sp. DB6_IX]